MLTTLLKVYSRGGIFEKAKELLTELEASGFAQDEVKDVASHRHIQCACLHCPSNQAALHLCFTSCYHNS